MNVLCDVYNCNSFSSYAFVKKISSKIFQSRVCCRKHMRQEELSVVNSHVSLEKMCIHKFTENLNYYEKKLLDLKSLNSQTDITARFQVFVKYFK